MYIIQYYFILFYFIMFYYTFCTLYVLNRFLKLTTLSSDLPENLKVCQTKVRRTDY